MSTESVCTADRDVRSGLNFLETLLGSRSAVDYAVRFWDGTMWRSSAAAPPRFTLVLQRPAALRRLFLRRDHLALGEAYIYDDFDIEGDIEAAFALSDHLLGMRIPLSARFRLAADIVSLLFASPSSATGRHRARLMGRPHSQERDAKAVTHHYNVSNDFYRLWLDRQMIYSCAYFADGAEDLDSAQDRKLDYLCRKLRLQPGDRLLDIGCGWGGLLHHAAVHYGADGVGITLSQPQADWANERFHEAGLAGCCQALVCDYRQLDQWESFDKIVSVGMFEHVGEKRLREYFLKAWKLLKPGGVFLNHGIAAGKGNEDDRGHSPFIQRYVFPDGELLPIILTLQQAVKVGFEVRDLENLREHYALTLRHWIQRLEDEHEAAVELLGETGYRIWRLYMAGSAHGFTCGRLNLYQALLSKPLGGNACLPLTRGDWYP